MRGPLAKRNMVGVAQWWRTDFSLPSFRSSAIALQQGLSGGTFIQCRWALLTVWTVDLSASAIGVAQFVTHTWDTRQFTHQERIVTRHGMATYIQWRRIPDRSESTPKVM